MKKTRKGFTLIELLVVIAIIGILSTVVLVNLSGTRARARDARRRSDLANMRLAIEMFYDANNSVYPDDAASWADFIASADGLKIAALMAGNSFPKEPLGGSYTYCYSKDETAKSDQYKICAYIETGSTEAVPIIECLPAKGTEPADFVSECSTAANFGRS